MKRTNLTGSCGGGHGKTISLMGQTAEVGAEGGRQKRKGGEKEYFGVIDDEGDENGRDLRKK